ncbi:MAG: sugar ABC transporter substrate-binding protein [Acidobacteria bacterium]|nr:sugar ABC transporter substrate-binding protein [Acidobacteriota bacterium]
MVTQLLPEFTRRNPGILVEVQQIPWTAAHEKLLTAFVGDAMPDLAPIGNTWVPEFQAIGALEPLDARAGASGFLTGADDFSGVWETNVLGGKLWGVPWYVDTRVVFYRRDLLAAAGFPQPPATWSEWRRAMEGVRAASGGKQYGILLPSDEWAQPVILGMERGSSLLKENGGRGAFSDPAFRGAAEFYVSLFRDSLAPVLSWSEIGNVYQEFARGTFAMWITGPWNIGEFRRKMPPDRRDAWGTAPIPSPEPNTPGVSLAGGSSLVLFRSSRRKDDAWKLVQYLSEPAQQVLFYRLVGDLPARRSAWLDPALARDPAVAAFRTQLERVLPTPKVPEWEQIATRLFERLEPAIRGRVSVPVALAALDADVDAILTKRRWMLSRGGFRAAGMGAPEARDLAAGLRFSSR